MCCFACVYVLACVNVTKSTSLVLILFCRKKINNEISALDKAIKDLRKGEGGLADEYGVMTDNLQKSVQKEVCTYATYTLQEYL